jgi:hypothetical protein
MSPTPPDWNERAAYFLSLVDSPEHWKDPKECPNGSYRVWPAREGKLRYKAECVLSVSPKVAIDLLWNFERRGEWDELCEMSAVVGEHEESHVIYFLTKGQWPVSSREEVLWIKQLDTLGEGTLIIGTNCEEDSWKVRGKGVKMFTAVSGQLIYPHKEGCRLVLLVDNDPGGLLPGYLVRQISTSMVPDSIKRIRSLLEDVEAVVNQL